MSTDSPTLTDVITTAMDVRLEDMHVSMPGRVVSYDATKQSASVQPLVKRITTDETGARVTETLPIINDVPVVFPGAGSYAITWPITVGDSVLLVFAETSLDRYLLSGNIVDPIDPRRFALSDAIAIPGLRPFNNPVPSVPTNALVIKSPGEIRLGSASAADPVVRQSDLAALRSWAATHIHPSGSPNTSTPTVPPPAATGSSKVKAE